MTQAPPAASLLQASGLPPAALHALDGLTLADLRGLTLADLGGLGLRGAEAQAVFRALRQVNVGPPTADCSPQLTPQPSSGLR